MIYFNNYFVVDKSIISMVLFVIECDFIGKEIVRESVSGGGDRKRK